MIRIAFVSCSPIAEATKRRVACRSAATDATVSSSSSWRRWPPAGRAAGWKVPVATAPAGPTPGAGLEVGADPIVLFCTLVRSAGVAQGGRARRWVRRARRSRCARRAGRDGAALQGDQRGAVRDGVRPGSELMPGVVSGTVAAASGDVLAICHNQYNGDSDLLLQLHRRVPETLGARDADLGLVVPGARLPRRRDRADRAACAGGRRLLLAADRFSPRPRGCPRPHGEQRPARRRVRQHQPDRLPERLCLGRSRRWRRAGAAPCLRHPGHGRRPSGSRSGRRPRRGPTWRTGPSTTRWP